MQDALGSAREAFNDEIAASDTNELQSLRRMAVMHHVLETIVRAAQATLGSMTSISRRDAASPSSLSALHAEGVPESREHYK